MMHLDRYPPAMAAVGVGLGGVRQEIAAAVLCGQNPAAVVPVALGLRRLHCGWKSKDSAVAVGPATALIGSTEAVATLSEIGLWIVFGSDLFGGPLYE